MDTTFIATEDRLRTLALAVARNRVGPNDPITDVLAREGVLTTDFEQILGDAVFRKYVKAFVTELTENGFSFAAKCRLLAEDAVEGLYHLSQDEDTPAAARVKAVENLVEWGGLSPKGQGTGLVLPGAGGYQLVINFNGSPETFKGVTIDQPVKNPRLSPDAPLEPVFEEDSAPRALPITPPRTLQPAVTADFSSMLAEIDPDYAE